MIKRLFISALLTGLVCPFVANADDYVDDIYFNPKKDKSVGASKKKASNYIANFSDMDVDAYNLRGQYYSSPVDTIGTAIGEGDDFVYTQQIQKYYNPTIVLDNSELLADVLDNSYGNVEIVFNGLTPAFMPVYSYGWPYYGGYYNPYAWNLSWGWGGWNFGWYDPWYWGPSWSWGPSWAWGPSWGWGPSWAWGPSWGGPAWGGGFHHPSTWSPNGNRPAGPGAGWAGNSRPGGNHNGVNSRPGNSSSDSRWGIGNTHRVYGMNNGNSDGKQSSPSNRGYTIGNNGHRYTGAGNSGVSNTNRNNNTVNSTNNGTHRTYNNNGYNSTVNTTRQQSTTTRGNSTFNSNRSSGNGSFGGGSFGGGRSGGGSHSGGGGRGGRR